MRQIIFMCLLAPLIAIGQDKNVVNGLRVFPKIDKVLEFKKRNCCTCSKVSHRRLKMAGILN